MICWRVCVDKKSRQSGRDSEAPIVQIMRITFLRQKSPKVGISLFVGLFLCVLLIVLLLCSASRCSVFPLLVKYITKMVIFQPCCFPFYECAIGFKSGLYYLGNHKILDIGSIRKNACHCPNGESRSMNHQLNFSKEKSRVSPKG